MTFGPLLPLQEHGVVSIFERKTIPDFNASLKDGRYRNQKLRLLEWKNNPEENVRKDVIYILEEKFKDFKDKAYWGAIINANLRDGIFVIQTDGLARTAEIIMDIRKKIEEGKFTQLEGNKEDIHLEGLSKGDYNTPQNCYLGQLSIIPNVSKNTAKILANKHPTMKIMSLALSSKKNIQIRVFLHLDELIADL